MLSHWFDQWTETAAFSVISKLDAYKRMNGICQLELDPLNNTNKTKRTKARTIHPYSHIQTERRIIMHLSKKENYRMRVRFQSVHHFSSVRKTHTFLIFDWNKKIKPETSVQKEKFKAFFISGPESIEMLLLHSETALQHIYNLNHSNKLNPIQNAFSNPFSGLRMCVFTISCRALSVKCKNGLLLIYIYVFFLFCLNFSIGHINNLVKEYEATLYQTV